MLIKNKLLNNIISHAGANFIGMAIQLGLLLILIRTLPTETLALFLSATALIAIIEMASDFGTRILATKAFSQTSINENIYAVFLGTKILLSSIVYILLFFLPIGSLSIEEKMLCISIAITQPSNDPLTWYFQGKERLDINAKVLLIWRVTNALLLIIASIFFNQIIYFLLIWFLTNLLRILFENFIILKSTRIDWFKPLKLIHTWQLSYNTVLEAIPIGIAFVLISFFQRLGVLLLNNYSNSHETSLYGSIFTIVASAGFIGTSVTLSYFPQLSRLIKEDNKKLVSELVKNKLNLLANIFLPLCITGILLAPFINRLLLGDSYKDSYQAMIFLFFGLYISTINFSLKYLLNILNMNWYDSLSVVYAIGTFIIIFLFFPKTALITAIAWSISEKISFVYKIYKLLHIKKIELLFLKRILIDEFILTFTTMVYIFGI